MSDAPLSGRRTVEVLIEDSWRPGRLRSCDADPDDRWTCLVTWEPAPGVVQTDRFPIDRVR